MLKIIHILTQYMLRIIELHSNDKDPKLKVGDHVRIFEYKNIFAKEQKPNWSEEVLYN